MTEHLPLSLQDGAEETLARTDAQDPAAPTGTLCAEKVSVAGRGPTRCLSSHLKRRWRKD